MVLRRLFLVLAALSVAEACDNAKAATCATDWKGANTATATVAAKCEALSAYNTCIEGWAESCTDAQNKLGMTDIVKDILAARQTTLAQICKIECQDQPVCAPFNTFTTTLTPWDSSASSGSDVTSLKSSYSSSFKWGLSGDSSGSNASSGSTGSGSSGSYMRTWQWLLLIALCLCCCAGAGGAAAMGKKPKKKKPTPKPVPAPAPEPEPVPVLEPLMPLMMPAQPVVEYIPQAMPMTTAYAAPATTAYAAPATTAYAAPATYAAAPAAYMGTTSYATPYSGGAIV